MKFNLYGSLTEPIVSDVTYDEVIVPGTFAWAASVVDFEPIGFMIGEKWNSELTKFITGNEKDTGYKQNNIVITTETIIHPHANKSLTDLFPELAVFRYPVIFIQSSDFPIFFAANSANAYRIFVDSSDDEEENHGRTRKRTYNVHLHNGITI